MREVVFYWALQFSVYAYKAPPAKPIPSGYQTKTRPNNSYWYLDPHCIPCMLGLSVLGIAALTALVAVFLAMGHICASCFSPRKLRGPPDPEGAHKRHHPMPYQSHNNNHKRMSTDRRAHFERKVESPRGPNGTQQALYKRLFSYSAPGQEFVTHFDPMELQTL